ncbi:HIT family protein [Cryptosporangium aurantiacum]|uniref:Diadenosine tetraphosphate (Ap4A) hydrolase n=1 Tax=Cryptosporangium aurantiacum TaxID=134849 RepID=A0A1M7RMU6_9ACTN|nr:HIT family protein [Cryptosporangium aurantiacum]SHN47510.1 Diadenosine tetraphosphate (Ap4A) hydrolase [Cryptosporangium aurantiacum]
MDCVFCAIVRGESPASLVHADDDVLAFLDIRPVTPGHLLVIPRRHAVGLSDLPTELGPAIWGTAQRLAGALRGSGVRCDGVNLFLADGEPAGQEVFHVHLHVVPRFAGDGFRLDAQWRFPARSELDMTAEQIRQALPD